MEVLLLQGGVSIWVVGFVDAKGEFSLAFELDRSAEVSKVLDGKGLTFHCFRLSVSFPYLHPLSPSPY